MASPPRYNGIKLIWNSIMTMFDAPQITVEQAAQDPQQQVNDRIFEGEEPSDQTVYGGSLGPDEAAGNPPPWHH